MSSHFFFGMIFGITITMMLVAGFMQGMNVATAMMTAPEVRVK